MEFDGDSGCGRWIASPDANGNRHRYSCTHPNTFTDADVHSYRYSYRHSYRHSYRYSYRYSYRHSCAYIYTNSYTDAYSNAYSNAYTYQRIWHYLLLLQSSPWPSVECDAQLNR
jgi:hypothetical protein